MRQSSARLVVKGGGFITACKKVREVLRAQAEINSSANLRIMVGFGTEKNIGEITSKYTKCNPLAPGWNNASFPPPS